MSVLHVRITRLKNRNILKIFAAIIIGSSSVIRSKEKIFVLSKNLLSQLKLTSQRTFETKNRQLYDVFTIPHTFGITIKSDF